MTTTTTPCACSHWTVETWLLGAVCIFGLGLLIYGLAAGQLQAAIAEQAVRTTPTPSSEMAQLWLVRVIMAMMIATIAVPTALNVWTRIARRHYNQSYDHMFAQVPVDRAAHERRVRSQSEFGR